MSVVCLSRGHEALVFACSGTGSHVFSLSASSTVKWLCTSIHDASVVFLCAYETCTIESVSIRSALETQKQSSKLLTLSLPPVCMSVFSGPGSTELGVIQCSRRNGDAVQLKLVDLSNAKEQVSKLAKLSVNATPVCSSRDGSTVCVADRRVVFLWHAQALVSSDEERRSAALKPLTLHHTKNFTCVALSPNGDRAAAGDVTGRVLIWHGLREQLDNPSEASTGVKGISPSVACTTLHWHASAVGTLLFSIDGAHLYSGGQEGVLVQWDLQSNERSFLPRIGAPVKWLAFDGSTSLLAGLQDNTVRQLSFHNKTQRSVASGIRPPKLFNNPSAQERWVTFDHRSGCAMFAACPTSIQLFNLAREEEIHSFMVVQRDPASAANGASGKVSDSDVDEGGVVLMALSRDGTSMATVDRRLEHAPGSTERWHEDTLRFWDRPSKTPEAFVPGTRADDPHFQPVTAISHSPVERVVATASESGELRFWQGKQKSKAWWCRAANARNDTPIWSLAFSDDGTTLAVGSTGFVELWDPKENIMAQTLGCHSSKAYVGELAFVPFTALLVGIDYSSGNLLVWHLPSLCLHTRLHCTARTLATDPKAARLALAAVPDDASPNWRSSEVVTVFDCSGSALKASMTFRPGLSDPIKYVAFPASHQLALISNTRKYRLVSLYSDASNQQEHALAHEEGMQIDAGAEDESHTTRGLSSIFGSVSRPNPSAEVGATQHALLTPITEVSNTPSNALPTIETLCNSLLNRYLEQ